MSTGVDLSDFPKKSDLASLNSMLVNTILINQKMYQVV